MLVVDSGALGAARAVVGGIAAEGEDPEVRAWPGEPALGVVDVGTASSLAWGPLSLDGPPLVWVMRVELREPLCRLLVDVKLPLTRDALLELVKMLSSRV